MVGHLAAAVASILPSQRVLSFTELGTGIGGPDHAQAGVQRLDHALHQQGWRAQLVGGVLGEQADQQLAQMRSKPGRVVLLQESSVRDKAESEPIVGQSAVRSRRARRLSRTRKHLFPQVQVPLRVPGLEGEQRLLVGPSGLPVRVERGWWHRHKGEQANTFAFRKPWSSEPASAGASRSFTWVIGERGQARGGGGGDRAQPVLGGAGKQATSGETRPDRSAKRGRSPVASGCGENANPCGCQRR